MKNFILQTGRYVTLGVMVVGAIGFTLAEKMHAYDYFSLSCAIITLLYQILDHHHLGRLENRIPESK